VRMAALSVKVEVGAPVPSTQPSWGLPNVLVLTTEALHGTSEK
jgi:hypothetical protein